MSEVVLTEQLDQVIEAMLRNADAPRATADSPVVELASIAVELRALPRADFKAHLKTKLEEAYRSLVTEEEMDANDASPGSANDSVRATFRTVTPYLTVADVHEEIEFVTKAFGAEGKLYGLGSAGGYHSEYRIGDSMVMIGGGGEGARWKGTPAPAAIHLYVEDIDAVYERALASGATSLYPPTDHEYGERGASVADPGGNHWYLATASGAGYVPEGATNLMPYLHPRGAPKMIEFL